MELSSSEQGATAQWLHHGYTKHSAALWLSSLADLDMVSSDESDALEVRVELAYRDLLAKEVCEDLSDGEKEALPLVTEAYSKIRQVVESSILAPPCDFPSTSDCRWQRGQASI